MPPYLLIYYFKYKMQTALFYHVVIIKINQRGQAVYKFLIYSNSCPNYYEIDTIIISPFLYLRNYGIVEANEWAQGHIAVRGRTGMWTLICLNPELVLLALTQDCLYNFLAIAAPSHHSLYPLSWNSQRHFFRNIIHM